MFVRDLSMLMQITRTNEFVHATLKAKRRCKFMVIFNNFVMKGAEMKRILFLLMAVLAVFVLATRRMRS